MPAQKKSKARGRKIGREGRHPAHQRYVAERRWARKKANNILRMKRKHPNYRMPNDITDDTRAHLAKRGYGVT